MTCGPRMQTSPRSPGGRGSPPPRGRMVISVSKIGTPTVPALRVPERNEGLPVACMVTSVSPYPSPITASGSRALILQRQLWRGLSAGSVVSAAGLGLASSPPPGPVVGGVEVGPRSADEGVQQAPQLGHGQRDELAGSGCGAPFLAVARVADR